MNDPNIESIFLDKLLGFSRVSSQKSQAKAYHKVFIDKLVRAKKIAKRATILIMSECLDKISILSIITQEKADPAWSNKITYKPLDDRINDKEEGFELFVYTSKKKLVKDLCMVCTSINIGVNDLLFNNTVNSLTESLVVYNRMRDEEKELLEECARNKILLRKLTIDMRKSFTRNKDTLNKKADEAYQMQEKYEETLGYGTAELKYVERYENNRAFLNKHINDAEEQKHQSTIDYYKKSMDMENRIHKEIGNFMEVTCADMQEQIEHWMTSYDEDVERIEKEHYELKIAKEKMEMEFEELTQTYANRQKEIADWLDVREQMRQKEDLEKRQLAAAIKIQAWWRGVMVRKHLGPYRKGKKGKKGKGKGKGKGKK